MGHFDLTVVDVVTPDRFIYKDLNGNTAPLNWELAQSQGCSDEEMEAIVNSHIRRVVIFAEMAAYNFAEMAAYKNTAIDELRRCAAELEELEFEMQAYWHFKHDRNHHTWWLFVPHCRCPKMDNQDPMYFGRRIILSGCPVHGGLNV